MNSLGLNIISGSNESQLLKRCLTTFDAKNLFDEIVIINTSNDKQIDLVAEEFDAKVLYFDWITEEFPAGNFGGAREFARENSTTDKIMWLDTDDILLKKHKEKFIEFLNLVRDEKHRNIKLWKVPYSLIYDASGEPEQLFLRERVFDRQTQHWEKAVHEIIMPAFDMVEHGTIGGTYITHAPIKPQYASALRNLNILKYEYEKDPSDVQTKYFYGRDSLLGGEVERGIQLLEEVMSELGTGTEMLYAIAIDLAWFYSYGAIKTRPGIENFQKENILKVESYCRLALSFSFNYAEPYVLLGDVYYYNGEYEASTKMYLTALQKGDKNHQTGMFKSLVMSGEVPCDRLSFVYEIRGLLGMALHYNKQSIRHNQIERYVQRRKMIINNIQNEMKTLCQIV